MQHRWPPMAMAIKAIIRNCRSWQGRIISNEEVACGVAIAVHCFDWYQKCARKKSNFPQKRTFSDNSKFRYQKKHSQKHFWGEEADARRLQILFLILAHYVCVLGCCCCCNNSCWVVNSLGSRITYISHLRTEQRPEVHLIRKYFWWPIMT